MGMAGQRPWWLESQSELSVEPSTAPSGLSSLEAKNRLAQCGPDLFHKRDEKSLLRQYLLRFKNPLVLILLAASAVSAFTGEVMVLAYLLSIEFAKRLFFSKFNQSRLAQAKDR